MATGMRQNGSISVALTAERREESAARRSMARASASRCTRSRPTRSSSCTRMLNADDVVGARATCRGTASAIRPTSPWRWPRARASAARRSSRTPRSPRVLERDGRVTGVDWSRGEESGTIQADIVVNCAGMWARELGAALRRERAAACLRAFLYRHRADPRTSARPAGAARAGRMRLLQGRCRQDPARLLRAQGQALGDGRHPRGFLLRPAARGHRALRADPGAGHRAHAAAADRRHPHLLQRPGELYPG